MTQRERWVLCRADPFEVDPGHVATLSAEGLRELRWWSVDELRSAATVTTPAACPSCWTGSRAATSPAPTRTLASSRPVDGDRCARGV